MSGDKRPSSETEITSRRLVAENIFTVGAIGIAQLGTLLATIAVARSAGPASYSLLALMLAVVALGLDVTNFGTHMDLPHRVAIDEIAVRDGVRLVWDKIAILYLPVTASLAVIGWSTGHAVLWVISAQCILLQSASTTLVQLLRAMGRHLMAGAAVVIEKITLGLMAVLGIWAGLDGVAAYMIAVAISTLIAVTFCATNLPSVSIRWPDVSNVLTTHWRARHFALSALSSDLSTLEAPIVTALGGPVSGGQFAAANRFSGPLGLPASGMSTALFTRLAGMSPRRAGKVTLAAQAAVFVIFAPILLIVLFFADPLVNLLFGASYGQATAGALQLVVVAVLLGSVNQLSACHLQAQGHSRETSKIVAAAMVAGLAFVAAGAVWNGVIGAAVGILGKELFTCIALAVRRRSIRKTFEFHESLEEARQSPLHELGEASI